MKNRMFFSFFIKRISILFFVLSLLTGSDGYSNDSTKIVNDVTQINPVKVDEIIEPKSIEEIVSAVKRHNGPISIGGGRYSMGGQTATENALHIDMRQFNKVISFSKENKEITVQTGIRWRQIQEYIDPFDLSIKIMQTYSSFTVGGSLSVNVHGRYIGLGPLIMSVKSIKIVLADGTLIQASHTENKEIFYGAIGGYGAMGVIVEATLSLAENVKVERKASLMTVSQYRDFFFKSIRDDSNVVFHNADIYPNEYTAVHAISYVKTDKPVTIKDRLIPMDKDYWLERAVMWIVSEMPFGKWLRQYVIDPLVYSGEEVKWRNYEASYDVRELEPKSRKESTYVLQEYFVPVEKFDEFVPLMAEIFNRHKVNVINVSIRHAKQDPGSLLAWARSEVFAFVVYYKQGTGDCDKQEVAVWTRELIDAATSLNGAYYLPYQIHATSEQFAKAYPNSPAFFKLKRILDPTNKFRNKLWDAYYITALPDTNKVSTSRIKSVMSETKYSDGIYKFLQNVYGLYPTNQFHCLISECAKKYSTDKEIYLAIQDRLPEVTPALWAFRYALPALSVQKKEIAAQTASLLGVNQKINGYLEIGTTGRYVNSLKDHMEIKGPVYLSYYEFPGYGPQDVMERGQLSKIGTFFDLKKYTSISPEQIRDTSLDLVTIYIGLHHCHADSLENYVNSINRVLRPGGRLVIRDHNVTTPEFGKFVSVVHDIFYCGLNETWEYTSNELRNYTASDSLTAYLERHGFKGDGRRLLQKNDPSKNTLMVFTKTNIPMAETETSIHEQLISYKGYKRDEAQTYLTLPEWFLVFSPDEYAQFLKKNDPSGFPYFGSINQFWSYYWNVYQVTKEKYDVNWGYHFMVLIIGSSYSVENAIKGVYENTVGRLSELIRGSLMTEEDKYAAKIAQQYVDFIRVDPWYDFPFFDRFKKLWTETGLFGDNNIRKWERKFFLSAEYGGKAIYACLIRLGTKAMYGDADNEMLVWASNMPLNSDVKNLESFSDSSKLISLPRYEKFRDETIRLIKEGAQFREIAGNNLILITCIASSTWKYDLANGTVLFEKPILTTPELKRIALNAPVKKLHEIIPQLLKASVFIEHIYDY